MQGEEKLLPDVISHAQMPHDQHPEDVEEEDAGQRLTLLVRDQKDLLSDAPTGEGAAAAALGPAQCNDPHVRSTRWWMWVLVAQLSSCILTGTGVFSQLLADRGVKVPTAQLFLTYALLCLYLIPLLRRSRRPLSVAWWKYALLAFADVEGNFLIVKAYQYSSITSVQLLDGFTIPCVMLLTWLFARTRYSTRHYVGAAISIIGLALLVVSDVLSHRFEDESRGSDGGGGESKSRVVMGDMLVLVACVFYAIANVGQEIIVKRFDRNEYLAMIGLFGFLISGVQLALVERAHLEHVPWASGSMWAEMIGFSLTMFAFYSLMPTLMAASSAVFVNLSLLTSDFWSLLAGLVLFHAHLHFLYFIAFFVIIAGVLTYYYQPAPQEDRGEKERLNT